MRGFRSNSRKSFKAGNFDQQPIGVSARLARGLSISASFQKRWARVDYSGTLGAMGSLHYARDFRGHWRRYEGRAGSRAEEHRVGMRNRRGGARRCAGVAGDARAGGCACGVEGVVGVGTMRGRGHVEGVEGHIDARVSSRVSSRALRDLVGRLAGVMRGNVGAGSCGGTSGRGDAGSAQSANSLNDSRAPTGSCTTSMSP